jgi:hypothetical protein
MKFRLLKIIKLGVFVLYVLVIHPVKIILMYVIGDIPWTTVKKNLICIMFPVIGISVLSTGCITITYNIITPNLIVFNNLNFMCYWHYVINIFVTKGRTWDKLSHCGFTQIIGSLLYFISIFVKVPGWNIQVIIHNKHILPLCICWSFT